MTSTITNAPAPSIWKRSFHVIGKGLSGTIRKGSTLALALLLLLGPLSVGSSWSWGLSKGAVRIPTALQSLQDDQSIDTETVGPFLQRAALAAQFDVVIASRVVVLFFS